MVSSRPGRIAERWTPGHFGLSPHLLGLISGAPLKAKNTAINIVK